MVQYIVLAVIAIVLVVIVILAAKRRAVSAHKQLKREGALSSQHSGPPNTQLYVGNIPYRTNDADLHAFFSHYGEIDTVRVIKDRRTGRAKGFAFITFVHLEDATAALDAHEKEFEGRSLIVRYAKPSGQ